MTQPLLNTYKALIFVDEYQDLSKLQLHVILRVYLNACVHAQRCNRLLPQVVCAGQEAQSIFWFEGGMHTSKLEGTRCHLQVVLQQIS